LTRVPHAKQYLLYLLLQSREHVNAHRYPHDELTLDSFRHCLPVLDSFRNLAKENWLDESKIKVGDTLRYADVGVIGRAWVTRRVI
jgi:hypothetical protein